MFVSDNCKATDALTLSSGSLSCVAEPGFASLTMCSQATRLPQTYFHLLEINSCFFSAIGRRLYVCIYHNQQAEFLPLEKVFNHVHMVSFYVLEGTP